MPLVSELGDMHILMEEKELMPHADHRNLLVGQFVCNRAEQFVKIHDDIGTAVLDIGPDQ